MLLNLDWLYNALHLFEIMLYGLLVYVSEIFLSNELLEKPQAPDKSVLQKIIFLISQLKHMLWVLKRTVAMRRFF